MQPFGTLQEQARQRRESSRDMLGRSRIFEDSNAFFSLFPPQFPLHSQLNDANGKSEPLEFNMIPSVTFYPMLQRGCGRQSVVGPLNHRNPSGPLVRSTAAAQAPPEWMETNFSATTTIVTLHLPQLSASQRLSELNLPGALIRMIRRTPDCGQRASHDYDWGRLWGESASSVIR